MNFQAAIIGVVITVAASVWGGWTLHAWKAGSDQLLVERAVAAANKEQADKEQAAALNLEHAIGNLNDIFTRVTNEREEYLNRPVYLNPCRDDAGLRALNALLRAPADTGKPAN